MGTGRFHTDTTGVILKVRNRDLLLPKDVPHVTQNTYGPIFLVPEGSIACITNEDRTSI